MTEFTGKAAFSSEDSAVDKDACAQSLRHVHDDQIVYAVAQAEPNLRQCAGVGNVVHNNRQAGGLFDTRLDAPNGPVDVGREYGLVEVGLIELKIEAAWQTHANAVERPVSVVCNHLSDCIHDGADYLLG